MLKDLGRLGHWPTVVIAAMYFDCSVMAWISLGPLTLYITQDIGIDSDQSFAIVAIPVLSGAILRVVLGSLADHFGFKRVALACQASVVLTLAYAWQAGFDSLFALQVFAFFLGIAGAAFAVALPQASRWYPPQHQGLITGFAGAAVVGVLVVTLALPRIAAAWDWRAAYGFLLIPSIVTLVLYALFVRDSPEPRSRIDWHGYRVLILDVDSWWLMGFAAVAYGGLVGFISSLPLYFSVQFGSTGVVAGTLAGCVAVFGAASRAVGGWVADRLGGIRTLQALFAVVVFGMLALSFLSADGVALGAGVSTLSQLPPAAWLIVFLLLSSLLALGMGNGALFQLVPQRFRNEIGVMTGMTGFSGGVGGFVLARALGTSLALDDGFALGFQFFAALTLLGFVGLAVVKRRWRTTWGAVSGAKT